jgi:beta-glucosidase
MKRYGRRLVLLAAAAGAVLGVMATRLDAAGTKAPSEPYRNKSLGAEARVADLVKRMTLSEKITLISGKGFESRAVPRLGIPELTMTDGPNGIRWGAKATAFPVGIAIAATWDTEVVQRMGAMLAREAKAKGRNVLLAPCVNISRVPQNGRNFECFGEDPHLASRIVVPYIRGAQDNGVIATVKHFACNNQEYKRRSINVIVDKRTLHEIYFPAFEAAVKEGGVHAVMAAYNQVNGLFSTANPYLIDQVLKKRWGFQGIVMSDWDAVQETLGPIKAGLDLEMPDGAFTGEDKLTRQLECGQVTESMLDEKVRRILSVMFRTGAFDAQPKEDPTAIDTPEARAVALDVARASIVLLKNDKQALPLQGVRKVAVIGPGAIYARAGGGGSGSVRAFRVTKPIDALTEMLGRDVQIRYAVGFSTPADVEDMPIDVFSHVQDGKVVSGLKAEYFANEKLEGKPAITTRVASPDLHWSNDSPGKGVPIDNFSSRLTGTLTPKKAGRYRFLGNANNGYRMYLDDKLAIDGWEGGDLERSALEFDLEARPYAFRIDHHEGKGTASLQLLWGFGKPDPEDAIAAAKEADAAVLFVGWSAYTERESEDHGLQLEPDQISLIQKVAAVNKRTIVVLQTGSPILTSTWAPKVAGLIEAWYPGQEGGTAIAEILTGKRNPSGRLPFTFLEAWKYSPAFKTYPEKDGAAPYSEGVFVGYRHYDTKKLPVSFAFGHGLSYTQFVYRDLKVQAMGSGTDATYAVDLELENAGKRAGAEVVQLYVGEARPAVKRPQKELRGFEKIFLQPGEKKRVAFKIGTRALSYFDEAKDDFVARPGVYNLMVGASSRDIRLQGNLQHR